MIGGRASYLKKIINYIIYIKYMGGLGRVWNFITQTQPDPLSKNFCNPTQLTKS